MTEKKDLWWVLPASLALLILIGVSGAANFQYGLSFGGPVIGGASIASDIFKVVALIGVFTLWRSKHWLQAIALFMLFLGFTTWSMFSATGFMSTQFSAFEDGRGKAASDWSALIKQTERLEERRRKVSAVRPQKVIQAEIDAILRTPGVNGCVVIDGPITREQCPKLDELRKELAFAESAFWLDGRLEKLRNEMKGSDRVTVVDPRTDSLAAVSGVGTASIALFIKLFFAGLIELATAFGLWAVWSPFFNRKEAKAKPEGESQPQAEKPVARPDLARRPMTGLIHKLTPDQIQGVLSYRGPETIGIPPTDGGGSPVKTPKPEETKVADAKSHDENIVDFPQKSDQGPKLQKSKRSKVNKHGKVGRVVDWLNDATSQDAKARTLSKEAYANYSQWCELNGLYPVAWRQFTRKAMAALKIKKKRCGKTGQQIFQISLSNPAQWQKRAVA